MDEVSEESIFHELGPVWEVMEPYHQRILAIVNLIKTSDWLYDGFAARNCNHRVHADADMDEFVIQLELEEETYISHGIHEEKRGLDLRLLKT